jgi:hypothetical protein
VRDIIVRDLDVMAEANWSFRTSAPQWQHQVHGSMGTFDPFPCYPHQRDVVEEAAAAVTKACPPLWNVELFIADREETGRSNGYSSVDAGRRYVDGEWVQGDPIGLIMLSGKRIPPHPALTRYLVAHEYGHNVEWMLNRVRGEKSLTGGDLPKEYAEVRGLGAEHMHDGSGGRWHDSVHEILACDFRILVCEVEAGYWPHPGVPHPSGIGAIRTWWADQMEALSGAVKAA